MNARILFTTLIMLTGCSSSHEVLSTARDGAVDSNMPIDGDVPIDGDMPIDAAPDAGIDAAIDAGPEPDAGCFGPGEIDPTEGLVELAAVYDVDEGPRRDTLRLAADATHVYVFGKTSASRGESPNALFASAFELEGSHALTHRGTTFDDRDDFVAGTPVAVAPPASPRELAPLAFTARSTDPGDQGYIRGRYFSDLPRTPATPPETNSFTDLAFDEGIDYDTDIIVRDGFVYWLGNSLAPGPGYTLNRTTLSSGDNQILIFRDNLDSPSATYESKRIAVSGAGSAMSLAVRREYPAAIGELEVGRGTGISANFDLFAFPCSEGAPQLDVANGTIVIDGSEHAVVLASCASTAASTVLLIPFGATAGDPLSIPFTPSLLGGLIDTSQQIAVMKTGGTTRIAIAMLRPRALAGTYSVALEIFELEGTTLTLERATAIPLPDVDDTAIDGGEEEVSFDLTTAGASFVFLTHLGYWSRPGSYDEALAHIGRVPMVAPTCDD